MKESPEKEIEIEKPPLLPPGTIVRLKSGGPDMVISIGGYITDIKDNTYECIWFPSDEIPYTKSPLNGFYSEIIRQEVLFIVRQNLNQENFKVGDIVQLKCGGPLMVITEVDNQIYRCLWSDKYGKLCTNHHKKFSKSILRKER